MPIPFERMPNYPHKSSEIFGPPPAFDLREARVASADARDIISNLTPAKMPAVTTAVAMMLYNRSLNQDQIPASGAIMDTIGGLIQSEEIAQQPNSPLSTTGFEIEFPLLPAKRQTEIRHLSYALLSDALGLPENNNNGSEGPGRDSSIDSLGYWEVAPHFSYFHETQAVLISELLRMRYALPFQEKILTRIRSNPDSHQGIIDAVYNHVSRQGLSLHLNYGVPDNIEETMGYEADYLTLGAGAAIAFASQNRLEVGAIQTHLVKPNTSEKSLKINRDRANRLEFRGLEVLDETVYQTLEAMQLLTTALFEANKSEDIHDRTLAGIWDECIDSLFDIFPEALHEYEKVALGDALRRRESVAELAANNPEISPAIRKQLLKTAHDARAYLQSRSLYPST